MRVHFTLSPPRSAIWIDFLIRVDPFPPNLDSFFQRRALVFAFPCLPGDLERQRECGGARVSLEEQPVAMRDRHYRSTIYENKAICACFGACRLPTNGAVFTIPALLAFTFAIFTGPVLNAAGMAHALVASRACPALFAAAGSRDADAVSTTVY
jgi:hypothetical protein